VLRHTCASWHVAAGVPIRHVQQLLGHASVTTTERYEHAGNLAWASVAGDLPPRTRALVPIFRDFLLDASRRGR
jgi:site-specific recombinase XerD